MTIDNKPLDDKLNTLALVQLAVQGDVRQLSQLLKTGKPFDNKVINPLCFLLSTSAQDSVVQNVVELFIDYSKKSYENFITRNIYQEDYAINVNIAERLVLANKDKYLPLIKDKVNLREDFLNDLIVSYINFGKPKVLDAIEKVVNIYDMQLSNNSLASFMVFINSAKFNTSLKNGVLEDRLIDALSIYVDKNPDLFCTKSKKSYDIGIGMMSFLASYCSSKKLLEFYMNIIDFDVLSLKREMTSKMQKGGKKSVQADIYNYVQSLDQDGVDAVRQQYLLNKKIGTINVLPSNKFKL